LPSDHLCGALVISYIAAVPARSGGTLVVEGSPALIAGFLDSKPHLRTARMKVTRRALLQSDPWLRSLCFDWTNEDWTALLPEGEHLVGGVATRVGELTGEPGDVVIGHPWLLHTPAPNHGQRPRFMRVQRVGLAPQPK
jgi:hypothetical protein